MDYSAANSALWNPIIQVGWIALFVIAANLLRKRVKIIKNTMLPTAVLAGFLLLAFKLLGIIVINSQFFEMVTYHCIAIGFIALSLRIPEEGSRGAKGNLTGLKSGAIIVSSYMVQAITGLVISLVLAYTVKPDLFKACGILLPMGYGQGPGQANNIGTTYEALGFIGGRSFGLAIAATGYICACVVGVFYINYLVKSGQIKRVNHDELAGSVTVDDFQSRNELPISESIDRLSIQVALIMCVYALTFLLTWGLTSLFTSISEGLGNTVNSLLWGFNFIIGSAIAIGVRGFFVKLKDHRIMKYQYQNNYLLSRISGLAFDIMIIAGLATINLEDLAGLWLPFVLMVSCGAIVTLLHLKMVCKKAYGDYYYEGLVSMYGMMTGTISSGVLLLREIDPQLKTPAANNLVVGSSFAIMMGIPLLAFVGIAPKSPMLTLVTLGAVVVYYLILLRVVFIKGKK